MGEVEGLTGNLHGHDGLVVAEEVEPRRRTRQLPHLGGELTDDGDAGHGVPSVNAWIAGRLSMPAYERRRPFCYIRSLPVARYCLVATLRARMGSEMPWGGRWRHQFRRTCNRGQDRRRYGVLRPPSHPLHV